MVCKYLVALRPVLFKYCLGRCRYSSKINVDFMLFGTSAVLLKLNY